MCSFNLLYYTFFYKEQLYKEPTLRRLQKVLRTCFTKDKIHKGLLIFDFFITANNRELGSQVHSLQLNSHELCVIHVASVS